MLCTWLQRPEHIICVGYWVWQLVTQESSALANVCSCNSLKYMPWCHPSGSNTTTTWNSHLINCGKWHAVRSTPGLVRFHLHRLNYCVSSISLRHTSLIKKKKKQNKTEMQYSFFLWRKACQRDLHGIWLRPELCKIVRIGILLNFRHCTLHVTTFIINQATKTKNRHIQ